MNFQTKNTSKSGINYIFLTTPHLKPPLEPIQTAITTITHADISSNIITTRINIFTDLWLIVMDFPLWFSYAACLPSENGCASDFVHTSNRITALKIEFNAHMFSFNIHSLIGLFMMNNHFISSNLRLHLRRQFLYRNDTQLNSFIWFM